MTELFSFSRSAAQPFSLPPAPFITHQTCFWSALHRYLFCMGFLKRNMHTKQIKIKTKTKTTKQNKNKRKKNPTGSGREEEMKPYWAEVSRWQSREGNCLTLSMKAAQKDKMHRGRRKKKIYLGFLHWHEMAAFLLTASSHASCWHYTSCAVDPPPCWCLPNRIISCVTAVVTELLALQIPEHHFSFTHTATGHTTRYSGVVYGTLSAALLCLTFC